MNLFKFISTIFLCGVSCSSFNKAESEVNNSYDFIKSVSIGDYKNSLSFIDNNYYERKEREIKKKQEDIYWRLKKLSINVDTLQFRLDTTRDFLGRMNVATMLYIGFDSNTGLKRSILKFYYGPYELFHPYRITDIEFEEEFDKGYRYELQNKGRDGYFNPQDSLNFKKIDDLIKSYETDSL